MAGWRQTWRPLQLLVIFSLLILTNQSKMGGEAEEKLNLRGTLQEELHIFSLSLINKQLLHNHTVLDAILVGSDQQTMADRLQSAAEVSPSSTQEVLVPTRSSNPSDRNTRQENGSEPQQRLPVSRKLLYNQTVCGSEPDQQNPQMDQVAHEADPVSRTPRAAPSPDDPLVQFDQQQIVMLADDEVVRTAAASLYHKHPAVSSLHAVRPQHRVRQVKGQAAPLSERSSLVLVGHGAREPSGEMRISGYSYQDVARIIQSSSRIGQKIQTTVVVACGAGSDRRFPQALLQTLHRAGLETELHLWETAVQVAETGDVLSQDGARWRSGDHSKKLVLTVGRTGEIRRRDDRRRCTGQEVATNQTALLGKRYKSEGGKEDNKAPELKVNPSLMYRNSWPANPKIFINQNVFWKINQNEIDELNQNFNELEGLTWGMFHSDQPKPAKGSCSDPGSNENNYVLGKRQKENNMGPISWMNNKEDKENLLKECYLIKSGKDIRNIIRHFAKDGENEITYLMINNWIYEVDPQTLYVYPVGKKLDNNQGAGDSVKESIEVQMGKESYTDIKAGIPGDPTDHQSPKVKCVQYFKNIFLGDPANIQPVEKEAWCTTYFTASVISESARNFRTFPLILMALDMTNNNDQNVQQQGVKFLFDEHSMARGGSWIDPSRRGFSGSATPEGSSKLSKEEPKTKEKKKKPITKEKKKKPITKERKKKHITKEKNQEPITKEKKKKPITKEKLLNDLKNVISREYTMFTNWQKSIKDPHNYKIYVEKMAEIAGTFEVLNSDEKGKFITDCQTFFDAVKNQQNLPSASMIRKRSNIQPEVNK